MELVNNTLSWPELRKKIKLSNREVFAAPYEIDPLVLYDNSELDHERNKRYQIGELLREVRKSEGLTQQQLAIRSGTTKNYISRIENNRSDIELGTLRKIIELGLGKKLEIKIR